jgi:hypothetical protein
MATASDGSPLAPVPDDFLELVGWLRTALPADLQRRSPFDVFLFLFGYRVGRYHSAAEPTAAEAVYYDFVRWVHQRFGDDRSSWMTVLIRHHGSEEAAFEAFFDLFREYRSANPGAGLSPTHANDGRPVPRTIDLPELPPDPGPDDPWLMEFTIDRAGAERMWKAVLAMAVRDRASSVHFHPWRPDALAYVVGDARHALGQPPSELDGELLAVARELIAPGPDASPADAVGRVLLRTQQGGAEWVGVCWAAGGTEGADFFRLGPGPADGHA